jgi:hypothetical protein
MSFSFEPEKTLAAVAILVQETGESMYTVLKMLYLADRLHLEKYGRPITGDSYFAMQEGPAGTNTYDLMKFLRGERQYSPYPDARDKLRLDAETHQLEILREPDRKVFSESDLECITAIAALRNEKGGPFIRKLSHDPAWEATARNQPMDIMAIAATTKNSPLLAQHLADRFPGNA